MTGPADGKSTQLTALYIEKRSELVRFFIARTGSVEEAEDIVQEIYLKILGVDDQSIEFPAAYLYRLGSNLMLDRMRARRRATARDDAFYQLHRSGRAGGEDEAQGPSPDAVVDSRLRLESLIQQIETLPAQCKRVFVLHKLEGHSYAEIAGMLGISRSSVEKHMITALKRLSDHRP